MALVTRCSNPSCLTLFRVAPAQLQAFGGQVRCGACGTVFDAFPSLTTVADSALRAPERAAGPSPERAPADASEVMPDREGPEPDGTATSGPEREHATAIEPATAVAVPAEGFTAEELATEIPATEIPATEVPATEITPTEVMPTEVTPTEVPPTEVPLAALPPAVPPLSVPPADVVPSVPSDDALASRGGMFADAGVERVTEWMPDAPAPAVAVQAPAQSVDQVPDLRDEALFDSVEPARTPGAAVASSGVDPLSTAPESDAAVAPSPTAVAAQEPGPSVIPPPPAVTDTPASAGMPGDPAEPVARIASELTDYSVKGDSATSPASDGERMQVVGRFALLLLTVAGGVLVLAGDRLPPPLAGIGAALSPVALSIALLAVLGLVLRRYRATWIVAAVLLAALLAGQAVHAYRAQLAALYPASRPLLERFCQVAGCEVGLPKAAGQLAIEASDLQAVDASRPNLIQLTASVRNRAAIDVEYPAIEITLTDAEDRPMARRVLLPEQYLASRGSGRAGLRASEDFSLRLTLDTTELRPVGYRLYLFYP